MQVYLLKTGYTTKSASIVKKTKELSYLEFDAFYRDCTVLKERNVPYAVLNGHTVVVDEDHESHLIEFELLGQFGKGEIIAMSSTENQGHSAPITFTCAKAASKAYCELADKQRHHYFHRLRKNIAA